MKTHLQLFNFIFIGVFLFSSSCNLNSEENQERQDPERLERAAQEKRRREDILRREEFEDEYYDDYNYETEEYESYGAYDISSDEEDIDDKWRKVDYPEYEAWFEYGYSNQALEGIIMIKKVGRSIDYPIFRIGDKATEIEQSYQRNFPRHPASGFSVKEVDFGDYHDITVYNTRQKGSNYIDVEAIYSVDIDGEMFIILVENGGNVTQDFINNYEDFIEQLFIMK